MVRVNRSPNEQRPPNSSRAKAVFTIAFVIGTWIAVATSVCA